MLRWYRADLHIHTCLSPCGDLTMSPLRIVKKARAKKLDIIGICDHNSAENVIATTRAAKRARQGRELKVLAGMEVTSQEEVHVIAVFENAEDALALQGAVYAALPSVPNKPEVFGEQIIANEFDEVEGYNYRMLIGATSLTLSELVERIHTFDGLAVAAHVDRPSYSLINQLGFVPEGIELDAMEISAGTDPEKAKRKYPDMKNYPITSSSDAHFLSDIGKATTTFLLEEPTVEEIKMALLNEDGRSYKTR